MKSAEMYEWIATEFKPLILATPRDTVMQQISNAIRYWNTHSAYKMVVMADLTGTRVQLPASMKNVYTIIPGQETAWILRDHPLWTLVGVQVLDNVTSDLIVMSEAYKNYRYYTGTDLRWHFERSDDPTVGGYLYIINMPANSTRVCVVGTKRITLEEDITSEHICDWILRYAKALVKCIEGNTLRKVGLINATNDGESLVNEGLAEVKDLQAALAVEGRWAVMARRS